MWLKDGGESVLILRRSSGWSVRRALAWLRARGQQSLTEHLPAETQGLAIALLLGDGDPDDPR